MAIGAALDLVPAFCVTAVVRSTAGGCISRFGKICAEQQELSR